LFPDVYATSRKWFRRARELFRRPGLTKQSFEKRNDFSRVPFERFQTKDAEL